MQKTEIERFIKKHTMEFELELLQMQKRVTQQPNGGYAPTAALNLQHLPYFDQHKIVQEKWENLVDYVINVSIILTKTIFALNITYHV